jgi:hypothetical protein
VVERASSQLGKHHYELQDSSCEHFATWCATGSS